MEQIEDPYLAAFSESAANGLAMPAIPEMSAVWTAWGNAQQLIIQQQVEPQGALGLVQAEIERDMKLMGVTRADQLTRDHLRSRNPSIIPQRSGG